MDREEVVAGERFAGAGLGGVLADVLLDESLLVNDAWQGVSAMGACRRQMYTPDFLDTTGSWGASPETVDGVSTTRLRR